MGAYLTWTPKVGPAKSLFFDAVTEEAQDLASTATEHPVEEGANIADHIRDELERCSLEVFVSNQPVYDWNNKGGKVSSVPIKLQKFKPPLAPTPGAVFGAIGSAVKAGVGALLGGNREYAAQVLQFKQSFNAVSDTLTVLETLKKSRQLVNVVIPSKTYENMLIEKVHVSRNASTGDGAKFHLEFKQLRMVEAKIVNAPIPTEIRGATMKTKGAQGPKNAKAETQKKSIAKGLLDQLLGTKPGSGLGL